MPFAAPPPIASDPPCGPDLDLAFDEQYMGFMASVESWLPSKPTSEAYYKFEEDVRKNIDFASIFADIDKLAARTQDIRLSVVAAKFAILNRDISGFARWINTIAGLMSERWEEANPRGEGGDYLQREVALATLDEDSSVLMPLQYAPLIESPRLGALTYRAQRAASGAVTARVKSERNARTGQIEGQTEEKFIPSQTIERILRDVEIETIDKAHATLAGLIEAINAIKSITTEKMGYEKAVALPKLLDLVTEMTRFLREALVRRDPSRAPPAAEQPLAEAEADGAPVAPAPRAAFASIADVDAALGSALGYFQASEPSSPAVLLIRQARETLGKNLYEVMKLLAPAHADNARVFVGPDGAFTVPVKTMANAASPAVQKSEAPAAATRAQALALIDAVSAHYQKTEPSSPAPYLLERARSLATRDFLSLLHDVLPDDSLAAMKKGK